MLIFGQKPPIVHGHRFHHRLLSNTSTSLAVFETAKLNKAHHTWVTESYLSGYPAFVMKVDVAFVFVFVLMILIAQAPTNLGASSFLIVAQKYFIAFLQKFCWGTFRTERNRLQTTQQYTNAKANVHVIVS